MEIENNYICPKSNLGRFRLECPFIVFACVVNMHSSFVTFISNDDSVLHKNSSACCPCHRHAGGD